MLKRGLRFVVPLALAQIAFAGSTGLDQRGQNNCSSISTTTTTVFSQVTVTLTDHEHCGPPRGSHVDASSSTFANEQITTSTSLIASPTTEPIRNTISSVQESHEPVVHSSSTTSVTAIPTNLTPAKRGFSNMLYFGSWTIYSLGYKPQEMPIDQVSHVLYAFGDIADDGSVVSSDPFADVDKRFPGDLQETTGQNTYGNIKQLYLHKLKNRKLKTLFSIGGWTYSQEGKFLKAAETAQARERFASSAVKLMADWGFDGLDIDWEYPQTSHEAKLLTLLLQACREALDKYAADNGQDYHYLLTIAVSAGPAKYKLLDIPAIDQYLDSWHLMAYDYAGTWDHTTGHAANLFYSPGNPEITKANTHQAIQDYIHGGVSPDKMILGIPLYGRSFLSTERQLGAPFQGHATDMSADDGVWLYRDLPRGGADAHVYVDRDSVGAWSYDPTTRELVAFDNVETVRLKADYITNHRLGGAMFWEAAGDKDGDESLVAAVADKLGHLTDDVADNMIDYPGSGYENIRNHMGKGNDWN